MNTEKVKRVTLIVAVIGFIIHFVWFAINSQKKEPYIRFLGATEDFIMVEKNVGGFADSTFFFIDRRSKDVLIFQNELYLYGPIKSGQNSMILSASRNWDNRQNAEFMLVRLEVGLSQSKCDILVKSKEDVRNSLYYSEKDDLLFFLSREYFEYSSAARYGPARLTMLKGETIVEFFGLRFNDSSIWNKSTKPNEFIALTSTFSDSEIERWWRDTSNLSIGRIAVSVNDLSFTVNNAVSVDQVKREVLNDEGYKLDDFWLGNENQPSVLLFKKRDNLQKIVFYHLGDDISLQQATDVIEVPEGLHIDGILGVETSGSGSFAIEALASEQTVKTGEFRLFNVVFDASGVISKDMLDISNPTKVEMAECSDNVDYWMPTIDPKKGDPSFQ